MCVPSKNLGSSLSKGNLRRGRVTELKLACRLLELGYEVATPVDTALAYDLMTVVAGEWVRVQCKTCRRSRGKKETLRFDVSTAWSRGVKPEVKSYYISRADFFGLYAPWLDRYWLVPVRLARRGIWTVAELGVWELTAANRTVTPAQPRRRRSCQKSCPRSRVSTTSGQQTARESKR